MLRKQPIKLMADLSIPLNLSNKLIPQSNATSNNECGTARISVFDGPQSGKLFLAGYFYCRLLHCCSDAPHLDDASKQQGSVCAPRTHCCTGCHLGVLSLGVGGLHLHTDAFFSNLQCFWGNSLEHWLVFMLPNCFFQVRVPSFSTSMNEAAAPQLLPKSPSNVMLSSMSSPWYRRPFLGSVARISRGQMMH